MFGIPIPSNVSKKIRKTFKNVIALKSAFRCADILTCFTPCPFIAWFAGAAVPVHLVVTGAPVHTRITSALVNI